MFVDIISITDGLNKFYHLEEYLEECILLNGMYEYLIIIGNISFSWQHSDTYTDRTHVTDCL